MAVEQRIVGFRWSEWLWALRWRFPVWGAAAIFLVTVGARNDDGWLLGVGLLLVPGLLALSLLLQGVLAFLYLVPERWPAMAGTNAMLLWILAPYLSVAWLLGIAPPPPPKRRPVLYHPLHRDERSEVDVPYNPAVGCGAVLLLALIVIVLHYS